MPRLRVLALRNNRLSALPDDIGRLEHLWKLDLADNELQALPASIGALGRLIHLDLARNRLVDLPPSLCRLTRLHRLKGIPPRDWCFALAGNPLTDMPTAVRQGGTDAIMAYLCKRDGPPGAATA